MNTIPRFHHDLLPYLKPNKVLVIFGPRQIGKTTLLKQFLTQSSLKYKFDTGDNIHTQHFLGSEDIERLKEYAQGYDLIAIDEAQKIPQIGQALKILVDHVPNIKIIATGSSSFDLAGQIGEPLTGRKNTLTLYPIAQIELRNLYNTHELKEKLPEWLVFGGYPEVITTRGKKEKEKMLEEIVQSYLLKDILELDRVKSSKILLDLLRLLAFQVGNEVSLSELAQHCGIDYKTVARYLDLFEKSFVIYNLRAFSNNARKEIATKSKYYFYDNGIRNAVISNFNTITVRNDIGALWENFIFMERLKRRSYRTMFANSYFWRTYNHKEVDLVEERGGKLHGYEFKWSSAKTKKLKEWREAYPNASLEIITQKNYLSFVT